MQDNLTGDEMPESVETSIENIVALHPEAGVDKTLSLEAPESPESTRCNTCFGPRPCPEHDPAQALPAEVAEGLEELEELPSNVTLLNCTTRKDIPVDRILQGAKEAGLEEVVVVGFTKEGEEYLASSTASIQSTLFNLARGLHHTQRTCDECFSLSSNVRPAE